MVQFSVAATASPGGTVHLTGTETSPGKYESGSSVTATARPSPGYHFVNWTVGGTEVSTSPAYTFPVTADTALTATFTR
jgi:hypothetical protein